MLLHLLPIHHVPAPDEGRPTGTARGAFAHVVPVRELGVSLARSSPMQDDGADAPILKHRHQAMRIPAIELIMLVLLYVRRAHLERERLALQNARHTPHDALKVVGLGHEARPCTTPVHLVQGTAAIDIEEVAIYVLVDKLRDLGHCLYIATGDLHTEALLALVAAQESQLRLRALEDTARQSHLANSDVGTKLNTKPAKRQVPHRRKWREDRLPGKVERLFLTRNDGAHEVIDFDPQVLLLLPILLEFCPCLDHVRAA
mmetsp:Transcript_21984/g.46757  ORF Transcript_21984/g.46757 Transcript_21984/m.46757 type:complete len:259 (-) Transcript_21984:900-1676(-)